MFVTQIIKRGSEITAFAFETVNFASQIINFDLETINSELDTSLRRTPKKYVNVKFLPTTAFN